MRCVVVSVSSADDASSNSQIRPGRNSARAIPGKGNIFQVVEPSKVREVLW